MIKRVIAVGMILSISVFGVCGCKTKEDDLLFVATKKAKEAKSVEAEASLDMLMKSIFNDETTEKNIKITLKTTAFQEPVKVKMDMKLDTGAEAEKIEMQTYIKEMNGEYISYKKLPETDWTKQVIGNVYNKEKIKEQVNQFDIAIFLSNETQLVEKEEFAENDTTYKVFNGKITKNMMLEFMKSVSSIANMTGINEEEENKKIIDEAIEDMEDISYDIWIDSKEQAICRVTFSMSELMNKIIKENEKLTKKKASSKDSQFDMKTDITKMDMDIRYKNFNQATDFEIPNEALNANVIDTIESNDNQP